jgi:hypothetical protein
MSETLPPDEEASPFPPAPVELELPPFVSAVAATPDGQAVIGTYADGSRAMVLGIDPRLMHLAIAPYVAPAMRVKSVLPVAFRWAARRIPLEVGTVMDAVLAQAAADPDYADALEYAVRIERADLLAAGMPAELVDAVLELAATRPGSDAAMELVP